MSTIFAIVVNTPKLTKTTQLKEIFIVGKRQTGGRLADDKAQARGPER
jgi:hypothetical protein